MQGKVEICGICTSRLPVLSAQETAALLRDPERMAALAAACARRDYTNGEEVRKIYGILEREA